MRSKMILFLILVVNLGTSLKGQDTKQYLLFGAGQSFHGTGDFPGFVVDFGYQKFLKKKLGYEVNAVSTFHSGSWGNDYLKKNEQLYFVTAGFQAGVRGVLSVFSNDVHRMQIGVGPLMRYEMSSYPSVGGQYLIDPFSPTPLYTVRYEEPQNRLTIGYSVAIRYLVSVYKNNSLGFGIGFQNDTIGSTITNISVLYSRPICSEK